MFIILISLRYSFCLENPAVLWGIIKPNQAALHPGVDFLPVLTHICGKRHITLIELLGYLPYLFTECETYYSL